MPPTRQAKQQQQRALAATRPCPSCPQLMRLVGRESVDATAAELLTFQCACGQIIAIKSFSEL